ncbi:MAG: transcriptional regulator [Spirochaetales bacterium]|nr:transcriptional regulator [Spirochaetales bacterium]
MSDLYLGFDQIFFEKTRLSMISLLYREKYVSYNRFRKIIGGTDGAVYSHLKKLLEGGYIRKKKEIIEDTAHTIYSLTRKGEKRFSDYIDFMEKVVREYKGGQTNGNE